MPAIYLSAVITDGSAVLFELTEAPAGAATYSLPRFLFGEAEDSIEGALARRLAEELGIEVLQQEFVETLYERAPDTNQLQINNLQLVNGWRGAAPEWTRAGKRLVWMPLETIGSLDLPDDLAGVVLAAFGLDAGRTIFGALEPAAGRAFVVTGPAGAGKSTVARRLCDMLPRAALIELDELWHMVRNGRPVPAWEGGDALASQHFAELALRNAAALAKNFAGAGYDVVIEGVLEQPSELDLLLQGLEGLEVYFATLVPDLNELLLRDQGRPVAERMGARSRELHGIFGANGEFRGLHIDSTNLRPEATAQAILEQLEYARVL